MQNKFLIVERHPLFAEGLALCIEGAAFGAFIEHARTVTEAKAALYREKGFDLVLLDLSLSDTQGFDGLIDLRKQFPDVPIVIISSLSDQSLVWNALVCGAVGFIQKSASKHAVQQIIADVLAGDVLSSDNFSTASGGNTELATGRGRRPEPLTGKQLCVLKMLCDGLYNKQIAYKLGVKTTTVKSHITEILRKLLVASRTQAVIEVSKPNLVGLIASESSLTLAMDGRTSPSSPMRAMRPALTQKYARHATESRCE